jgi:hypothetical protein
VRNIENNSSTLNQSELLGFSILYKTGREEGLVTAAPEKKKAEVLKNMERRLRSGLRIGTTPRTLERKTTRGGRSKRNKGSKKNIRKTRRT